MSLALGLTVLPNAIRFTVRSSSATRMWVSIFDPAGEAEIGRVELTRERDGAEGSSSGNGLGAAEAGQGDVWSAFVPRAGAGTRYGFRADGEYAPERGLWYDPDKLLMDPYAVEIDRPYVYDPRLAAPRGQGGDTAALMPKAIVAAPMLPVEPKPPLFRPGGLIYELSVRAFTMRHPDVPPQKRGTIAALAEPAVIEHLLRLNVSAVELMPVVAWIDERHLPPLGLRNAWGYNPVSFMALDPRLAPGGLAELRDAVAALRQAGIGTILDLVFNHTGESDHFGPTLSLRGLDNHAYYRHVPAEPGRLVNDTGCGNTVACGRPAAHDLILDTLRHFVRHAGVDGFRFDLAPVLTRGEHGFDPGSALFREVANDPELSDRVLIAEPWDLGPEGYRLGRFPQSFLEWNDRYRDDVRRFWRGDRGALPALATRLAGSSDIFSGEVTRSVNFIAAHDGMALADLTAFERKHNEANGEDNRDGHNDNLSWNNGVEGQTGKPKVMAERRRDIRALLATLFLSRGTIMLTAGDEFGRTQGGNNNAYAQDNETTWVNWAERDRELERYSFALGRMRRYVEALGEVSFLTGEPRPAWAAGQHGSDCALQQADPAADVSDVAWLTDAGLPMVEADWHDPDRRRLTMVLAGAQEGRFAAMINGDRRARAFVLPVRPGFSWRGLDAALEAVGAVVQVPGRTVAFAEESVQPIAEGSPE